MLTLCCIVFCDEGGVFVSVSSDAIFRASSKAVIICFSKPDRIGVVSILLVAQTIEKKEQKEEEIERRTRLEIGH